MTELCVMLGPEVASAVARMILRIKPGASLPEISVATVLVLANATAYTAFQSLGPENVLGTAGQAAADALEYFKANLSRDPVH